MNLKFMRFPRPLKTADVLKLLILLVRLVYAYIIIISNNSKAIKSIAQNCYQDSLFDGFFNSNV